MTPSRPSVAVPECARREAAENPNAAIFRSISVDLIGSITARRAQNKRMRLVKPSTLFLSLCLGICATAAWAALKPGEAAPDFTVDAALGGKEFKFSLAEALKKGPVVLYFYPKSFTSDDFAETIKFLPARGANNHTGHGRYGSEFICVIDEHDAEDRPYLHVVPREITRAVSCADREGSRKRVSGHMAAAVILFERNRPRPNYLVFPL